MAALNTQLSGVRHAVEGNEEFQHPSTLDGIEAARSW
jgi:hypothetical protein